MERIFNLTLSMDEIMTQQSYQKTCAKLLDEILSQPLAKGQPAPHVHCVGVTNSSDNPLDIPTAFRHTSCFSIGDTPYLLVLERKMPKSESSFGIFIDLYRQATCPNEGIFDMFSRPWSEPHEFRLISQILERDFSLETADLLDELRACFNDAIQQDTGEF